VNSQAIVEATMESGARKLTFFEEIRIIHPNTTVEVTLAHRSSRAHGSSPTDRAKFFFLVGKVYCVTISTAGVEL
jgi:hypothetical protein